MKPSAHVGISAIAGAGAWGLSGSWEFAAWSAIAGVLIDLDHGYEYFLYRRRWVSLEDFFNFYQTYTEPKLYVWLHGIEWVMLLGLAAALGLAPVLTGGVAFGMLHHLVADQFGNGIRWGGYSILYRWLVRFESSKLFLNPAGEPASNS